MRRPALPASPAEALLARLGKGKTFDPQLIMMADNAPLFLSILEDAQEERVQLAALDALSRIFAQRSAADAQWSKKTIQATLRTCEHASPRLEAAALELLANAAVRLKVLQADGADEIEALDQAWHSTVRALQGRVSHFTDRCR